IASLNVDALLKILSSNGRNNNLMCFGLFKLPNLANLASFILSAYKNNAGTNLIVRAISNANVFGFTLISLNGVDSFSIAVTMLVIVVVNVSIEAIIMNKTNFHIVCMPLSSSFLENKIYINNINMKIKKNGLKFLINDEKFIFDSIINTKTNNENMANL